MRHDYLDLILQQWRVERPGLDASPMAVIGRISRLTRHFHREHERNLARFGLTHEAFDVLATLRRSGPPYRLSPTKLFRALLVSSGTMTNRLDRLEAQGLISRTPDPADRRAMLVGLTAAGRALIDRAFEAHLENERRLLAPLNRNEQQELAGLLRRLLLTHDDVPEFFVRQRGRGRAAAPTRA